MPGLVEHQPAEFDLAVGACRRHAAQQRLDARDQLARREWLGDVIVGAAFEAGNLVRLVGARGQHDDRDVAGIRVFPELARQLEATRVRKHPVHEQRSGRRSAMLARAALAVLRERDLESSPTQAEGDQVANRLLVLDDQDQGFLLAQPGSLPIHCLRIMTPAVFSDGARPHCAGRRAARARHREAAARREVVGRDARDVARARQQFRCHPRESCAEACDQVAGRLQIHGPRRTRAIRPAARLRQDSATASAGQGKRLDTRRSRRPPSRPAPCAHPCRPGSGPCRNGARRPPRLRRDR